jgi:hypothetical protein
LPIGLAKAHVAMNTAAVDLLLIDGGILLQSRDEPDQRGTRRHLYQGIIAVHQRLIDRSSPP